MKQRLRITEKVTRRSAGGGACNRKLAGRLGAGHEKFLDCNYKIITVVA
jgi:hypothetical protein